MLLLAKKLQSSGLMCAICVDLFVHIYLLLTTFPFLLWSLVFKCALVWARCVPLYYVDGYLAASLCLVMPSPPMLCVLL